MKNVFVIVMLAALTVACDEREKFVASLNDAPVLLFNTKDGPIIVKDSIKLSLKNSQKSYPLKVYAQDVNNNISSLTFSWLSNDGKVEQDGNQLNSKNILLPADGILNLRVYPSTTGLSRIVFDATDKLSKRAEATLELTGFNNLTPVAKMSVTAKRQFDELDYELDASASFDRDAKYGGQVVRYLFKIGDEPALLVDKPTIRKVFNEKKSYFITVQVQDNDGALSTVVGQLYDIR